MPKVVYLTADGKSHAVEVPEGTSAMEGAVQNLIPGIDGDCGGSAACGTCHVRVDESWFSRTGPAASEMEQQMLELTDGRCDHSRLACQIKLTAELDGLMLKLHESQH